MLYVEHYNTLQRQTAVTEKRNERRHTVLREVPPLACLRDWRLPGWVDWGCRCAFDVLERAGVAPRCRRVITREKPAGFTGGLHQNGSAGPCRKHR